jgi:RNA polymerase sigma-70 factor (ECF subfamily)
MKMKNPNAKQGSIQQQEYAEYSRLLYPSCLRILANPAEAEEAMHDVLLHYFSFSGHFESEAQKRSWLFKVAASKSIDRLRKKNAEFLWEEVSVQELDECRCHEAEQELDREVERVKRGLALLAPGYRTILSLFLFEGYDFEEIASILSLHPSTVRSQYVRGRTKLKNILVSSKYFAP